MGEGHVAKGGTIRRRGKSCFPRSTLVSCRQYCKPSSFAVQPPIRARCRKSFLFFFFFFFLFSLSSEPVSCDIAVAVASTLPCPHTGDIPSAPPQHHNYHTNPVAATTAATSPFAGMPTTCCTRPHTRRGHTQATPPPSPSLCLVHPKKPQISHFPFFPPSSLTVQDTSPRAHAGCPFAVATTATTSRPLQPAPPHQPHRPTTGVTRLCHIDRGCKRCTGSHHFRDTPICSPSPFV